MNGFFVMDCQVHMKPLFYFCHLNILLTKTSCYETSKLAHNSILEANENFSCETAKIV